MTRRLLARLEAWINARTRRYIALSQRSPE